MEKEIAASQGRLTRFIKLTTGEVRELVQPFIHDNPKYCYENAMNLLEKQHENPIQVIGMLQK